MTRYLGHGTLLSRKGLGDTVTKKQSAELKDKLIAINEQLESLAEELDPKRTWKVISANNLDSAQKLIKEATWHLK